MNTEDINFLSDFCFNDLYRDLNLSKPKMTIWQAILPFSLSSKWFESEYDLLEYTEEAILKRKKYFENLKNGVEDLEYLDSFLPGIARYDYIGKLEGENDVFMKRLLSYTSLGLKTTYISFETMADDGHLKILKKVDNHYFWQDYITLNYLKEIYDEFENLGLEFETPKTLKK